MRGHPGRRKRAMIVLAGWLMLATGLTASAQNAPSSSSSATPGEPPKPQVSPTADSYVVSLSTGELISTASDQVAGNASSGQPPVALAEYADGLRVKTGSTEFGKRFVYGLSVTSVYSNDYTGVKTPGALSNTISPYLALILPTKTGSFILQYNAVVNPHDNNVQGSGPDAYHEFSLTAQGALTRRWSWTLVGSGGYGSEAMRLEGPLAFSAARNVPMLDAGSTVLLPATNVLFFADTGRLVFQKNERNSFAFSVTHSYTGINGDPSDPTAPGEHSNTTNVRVDYKHLVSTRLGLTAYGEEATLFGAPTCSAYGGGVGLSARLSRTVTFDAEGGPEFVSPGCGSQKGGGFMATLTGQLTQKSRIYATVGRIYAAAYQISATWQDSAAGGFSKVLGRSTVATDGGFVRETFIGAPAYHGYFMAPRIRIKLVNSLGFTAGYRGLWVSGGGLPSGVLNFVMVSLDWRPAGLRFK